MSTRLSVSLTMLTLVMGVAITAGGQHDDSGDKRGPHPPPGPADKLAAGFKAALDQLGKTKDAR